jgi:5-methylcytosine-specific restriction endonuclease McrA
MNASAIDMTTNPDLTKVVPLQMGLDFDATDHVAQPTEIEREEAHFFLARMRESLERAGSKTHDMREPCRFCDFPLGVLVERGNQNTVKCARCKRHSYNAPKTETGQVERTVRTVRAKMKPSQQARILDRDHGRCVLCGTNDDLTIGHLLSVAEGFSLGASDAELSDDANLAAMCEGCNAGLGARSVSSRTYLIITMRLVQAEIRRYR